MNFRSYIRRSLSGLFFAAMAIGSALAADATGDVGLVNALQGEVSYQSKDGPVRKAQAYMRLRHGDKVTVAGGASIRISYFTTSRQESWTGPGSFVTTSAGGELLKGNRPDVAQLPVAVPQKLARVTELMNLSVVGGVIVRSGKRPTTASNDEIAEAMATYEAMRASTTPSDVTPELYLYAVFEEQGRVDDLKVVARDMLNRRPDNPDIQRLAKAALSAP